MLSQTVTDLFYKLLLNEDLRLYLATTLLDKLKEMFPMLFLDFEIVPFRPKQPFIVNNDPDTHSRKVFLSKQDGDTREALLFHDPYFLVDPVIYYYSILGPDNKGSQLGTPHIIKKDSIASPVPNSDMPSPVAQHVVSKAPSVDQTPPTLGNELVPLGPLVPASSAPVVLPPPGVADAEFHPPLPQPVPAASPRVRAAVALPAPTPALPPAHSPPPPPVDSFPTDPVGPDPFAIMPPPQPPLVPSPTVVYEGGPLVSTHGRNLL